MWLTQQMMNKKSVESGVYGGYSGEYDIVGESSIKEIPFIFPFGFLSVPKKSRELVFLKNKKDLCLGTVAKGKTALNKGEVLIYNDFGAFVKLSEDGSVNINGLVIDNKGNIIKPQTKVSGGTE